MHQSNAGADAGILAIFEKRRRNLYPVFWLSPEPPSATVAGACGTDFVHIPSTSASASLRDLLHIYGELSAIAPNHRPAARLADLEREIASGSPAAAPKIAEFTEELLSAFEALAPDLTDTPEPDEVLLQALLAATDLVADHARLARVVAQSGRGDCIDACYDGFGPLLRLADENHKGLSRYSPLNGDFGKFVVLEMFVTFIGFLIQAGRWEALSAILARDLYQQRLGYFPWTHLASYIRTLDEVRNRRLSLRRLSVAGDLFEQRHTKGAPLHKIAPYHLLEDADVFLMLRAAFPHATVQDVIDSRDYWVPFVMIGTAELPEFLGRSVSRAYAEPVAGALGLPNVDQLRDKVKIHRRFNAATFRGGLVRSPGDFRPEFLDQIATRP